MLLTRIFNWFVALLAPAAAPPRRPAPAPAHGRDSADQFALFARYAMAAYCPNLHNGLAASVVCANAAEPGCRALANATTVVEFSNREWYGVGGYVAVDPVRRHVVVAFKGTDSLVDVVTDVTKTQMDSDLCAGCRVHAGFGLAFAAVGAEAEAAVRRAVAALGGGGPARVVVTGHSLGGAVATLAAAHLRRRGVACDLYAYGSPRVSNGAFAALFDDARRGFTARITNGRDVVTAVPLRRLLLLYAYAHVAPEYWYADGLDGSAGQYAGRRRVCRSEDECGSAACLGWLPWCSIPDHVRYGGPFSPCGAAGRRGKALGGAAPVLPETAAVLGKMLRASNEMLAGDVDHAQVVALS